MKKVEIVKSNYFRVTDRVEFDRLISLQGIAARENAQGLVGFESEVITRLMIPLLCAAFAASCPRARRQSSCA